MSKAQEDFEIDVRSRMVSDGEQVVALRQAAAMMEATTSSYTWPGEVAKLREQADRLQHALDWFAAQVARVMPVAQAHWQEREAERARLAAMYNSDAPMSYADFHKLRRGVPDLPVPTPAELLNACRYTDPQQRFDVWLANLGDAGLLTAAERNGFSASYGGFPADIEAARAAQAEHDRLCGARDGILAQIKEEKGPTAWREALELYNDLGPSLDEEKLEAWTQSLARKHLYSGTLAAIRASLKSVLHPEPKQKSGVFVA